MPRMLIPSCSVWTGLAALALPLAAADPLPPAANSAAPYVRSYGGGVSVEYPPPAPLAPLPAGTVYGSPRATYNAPGTYAPGTTTYPAYSGTGSAYGPPTSYYTATGNGEGAIYGTPGGYEARIGTPGGYDPRIGSPDGYEARIGSPYHYYDPNGGQYAVSGNPYYDHFGPGYHRHSLHGHYRFPYYNYRAPWYYPGRAVYNRDTNFAW